MQTEGYLVSDYVCRYFANQAFPTSDIIDGFLIASSCSISVSLRNCSPERNANYKSNMLKKIIFLVVFSGFIISGALHAEPTPSSKKMKKEPILNMAPAKPLPLGWSLVNGVWMHSDGYKFEKGQIIRTGTQTHKKPPKPPTKSEMDAATKKKPAPLDTAAAKAAERERNLRPSPSKQTGTNL